jgi:hypothetical protein
MTNTNCISPNPFKKLPDLWTWAPPGPEWPLPGWPENEVFLSGVVDLSCMNIWMHVCMFVCIEFRIAWKFILKV